MKYKVGDRVRIKSLDWYNEHKDEYVYAGRNKYCGKVLTIYKVFDNCYCVKEDNNKYFWTDEMIEGLVEEESIIDLTVKGEEIKERIEIAIPEGYEYVIESGKIIFTKKKKEYPKTYGECAAYLETINISNPIITASSIGIPIMTFSKLIVCRDAYWKIAGEEMGLGEPWRPDWENKEEEKYTIEYFAGMVFKDHSSSCSRPFNFPTEEMRDAFKDNFDKDLETCKELL